MAREDVDSDLTRLMEKVGESMESTRDGVTGSVAARLALLVSRVGSAILESRSREEGFPIFEIPTERIAETGFSPCFLPRPCSPPSIPIPPSFPCNRMKAFVVPRNIELSELKLANTALPTLAPGQVLVKVTYTGLNIFDGLQVRSLDV